jgi:excisionase family DNA binding protein
MTDLPNKELLRVEEVAEYFSVTKKTIYLWIEHGHLDADKIAGSVIRITRTSVMKCRFAHKEQNEDLK